MAVEINGSAVVEQWKEGKAGVNYYEMIKNGIMMVLSNIVVIVVPVIIANLLIAYLKETYSLHFGGFVEMLIQVGFVLLIVQIRKWVGI